MYDCRTAAYKFCVALGGVPPYRIQSDGIAMDIRTIDELREQPSKAIRDELRHGSLIQWISVFYHENPLETFEEPYSYEHSLEAFLQMIGGWDSSEMHFKRFMKAEDQMQSKLEDSRGAWKKSLFRQRQSKVIVTVLSVVWVLLVLLFGIPVTEDFACHAVYYTVLPVAPALILMVVVRSYFRGHGFLVNILWALLAIIVSFLPAYLIKGVSIHSPSAVQWVVLLLSLVYIFFALRECLSKQNTLSKPSSNLEGVFEIDENKALMEKLYYTFKTKSFKFKGSNYGAIDDIVGESNAAQYEVGIKCTMWGILLFVLIIVFLWFHPSLLNHASPDVESWKETFTGVWEQIEQL